MHNLITHSLILFTCENTEKKKFWFSFFRLIQCAPRSIEGITKFKLNLLTCSIDRKWFSIDRKSWNSNFQNFSKAVFIIFMNKHSTYEHYRQRLMSKLNSIDAIALRFNLTYLNLNLNSIITSISIFIKS